MTHQANRIWGLFYTAEPSCQNYIFNFNSEGQDPILTSNKGIFRNSLVVGYNRAAILDQTCSSQRYNSSSELVQSLAFNLGHDYQVEKIKMRFELGKIDWKGKTAGILTVDLWAHKEEQNQSLRLGGLKVMLRESLVSGQIINKEAKLSCKIPASRKVFMTLHWLPIEQTLTEISLKQVTMTL